MADLKQLEAALRAADAAGNVEDARRLAQAYAAARAQQQPQADFGNVQGQASTKLDPGRVQIGGQALDDIGAGKRLGLGFAAPIADTMVGLSQITGIGSPEWQRQTMQRVDAAQSTSAGKVGSVGGNVAMALALPEAKALKAAPLINGAVQGAVFGASRGTHDGESRLVNTATGAGLGVVGSKLGSMLASSAARAQAAIPEATRAIAAKAEQYGIHLSPAQLSNSPFIQYLGSQFGILPGAGGTKVADQQSAAFNRALAQTIGVDAPRITPEVYAAKKAADSRAFEALTSRNNLTVTGDLAMRLKALQDDADIVGGQAAEATRNAIEGLYARMGTDGTVAGKAYQSLDSALGRATKGGGESAHYIGQVRDAIRNAMDDSISPADREAWATLRQQYGNRKTLRDLVAKSDGSDLSPQAVMGRVASNNSGKERMASGTRGALGDLARIGQAIKPPRSSGTAERLMVRSLANPLEWPSVALGITAGRTANSQLLAQLLMRENPGQTRQLLAPYMQGLPAVTPSVAPFWQQYPAQDGP